MKRLLDAISRADRDKSKGPSFQEKVVFQILGDQLLGEMNQDKRNAPVTFVLRHYPIAEYGIEPLVQILNKIEKINLQPASGFLFSEFIELRLIPQDIARQLIDQDGLRDEVRKALKFELKKFEVIQGLESINFESDILPSQPALATEEELDQALGRLRFVQRIRGLDVKDVGNIQTTLKDLINPQNPKKESFANVLEHLKTSKTVSFNDWPSIFYTQEGNESMRGQRPVLRDLLITGLSQEELSELRVELEAVLKDVPDEKKGGIQILDDILLIQELMASESEYNITGIDRTGQTADVYFIETPTHKYAIKAFSKGSFRDGSDVSRDEMELRAYAIEGIERHTLKTDFPHNTEKGVILYKGQILEDGSTPEDKVVTMDSVSKVLKQRGYTGFYYTIKAMADFYSFAMDSGYSPGVDYKAESYGFRENNGELEFVTYDLGDFYQNSDPHVCLGDFCEMLRCNLPILEYYIGSVLELSPYSFDPLIIFGQNSDRFQLQVSDDSRTKLLKKIDELFDEKKPAWIFLARIYKTANKLSPTRTKGLLNEVDQINQQFAFENFEELLGELKKITLS